MSVFVRRWSSGAAKLLLTGVAMAGFAAVMAPAAHADAEAWGSGSSPGAAREDAVNLCSEAGYSHTSIYATGTYITTGGRTYFYARARCS